MEKIQNLRLIVTRGVFNKVSAQLSARMAENCDGARSIRYFVFISFFILFIYLFFIYLFIYFH